MVTEQDPILWLHEDYNLVQLELYLWGLRLEVRLPPLACLLQNAANGK